MARPLTIVDELKQLGCPGERHPGTLLLRGCVAAALSQVSEPTVCPFLYQWGPLQTSHHEKALHCRHWWARRFQFQGVVSPCVPCASSCSFVPFPPTVPVVLPPAAREQPASHENPPATHNEPCGHTRAARRLQRSLRSAAAALYMLPEEPRTRICTQETSEQSVCGLYVWQHRRHSRSQSGGSADSEAWCALALS